MIATAITRALAGLSLSLRQPLSAYCTIETAHGDALVTRQCDYLSVIRLDGMRRMARRDDVARIATAQRMDLSGALEERGHAIVGWYVSDPEMAGVEIDRLNLASCRTIARELGLDVSDVLDERAALWPRIMRWEAAYYVLWTRRAVLTKEERRQMAEEQATLSREGPRSGHSQRYYLRSEVMAARHTAFVSRVVAALQNNDVASHELNAHEALRVIREAVYRETAGSDWKATLPGDRVMPRASEDPDGGESAAPGMLWPAVADQLFHADAETLSGQRVRIGDHDYAHVDMAVGPEDPRPFVELSARLGKDGIPWRAAFAVEGGGRNAMQVKEIAATFFSMFPGNADIRRAFEALRQARNDDGHIHGRNHRATRGNLSEVELGDITNHLYGADGTARLQGGADFDVSYEVGLSRSRRLRFRLNATPIRAARREGANIVLRPIPDLPPSLAEQLVEPGILAACFPERGMVIVSGGTGSGKSTLIAGMTVAKLADPDGHYNIQEAAAPIEFLLDRFPTVNSTMAQTEVPRDLPSFDAFIRGCMRREPTDIIVGECRDSATMAASVHAAISGHALTTTIHADNVPLTMQRITTLCPRDERDNLVASVAQSLRLVVNQRLLPSADGRRTAIREFLPFDSALRTRLLRADPGEWPLITGEVLETDGQSFRASIHHALGQGRITETVAARALKEIG